MTVYSVERWGYYHQGTFGIYSTKESAETALIEAKCLEPDDYHEFQIIEFQIDCRNDEYCVKTK